MVSKSQILGKPSLIFVTVGSTNFPFNRLFIAIDNALEELKTNVKLIAQVGPSTYKWKYNNIQLYPFLKPKKIERILSKADKIITHGGPGTLFLISKNTKCMPFIVPRLKIYNEHVNNHQQEFISFFFKNEYRFQSVQELTSSLKKYIKNPPPNLKSLTNLFPHSFMIQKLFNFINQNS